MDWSQSTSPRDGRTPGMFLNTSKPRKEANLGATQAFWTGG